VSLDSVGGRLELAVHDDGAGFSVGHRRGMGMENMAARAAEVGGSLDMSSRPGGGTLVRFSVPCFAEARIRYLAWAALWGVVLIGSVVNLRKDLDRTVLMATVAVAAIGAVGLTRSVIGHLRLRRRPERAA